MFLEHLGILLTTYCNLNCRDCADLIPKRCNRHYDFVSLQADLIKVLDTVEYIGEVLLIGGETLLYDDLERVIVFCRDQAKIRKIITTTNGTIIPSDSLIRTIKDNDVIVRISGYPDFVAPRRSEVVAAFQKADVTTEDLEDMLWLSMGNFDNRYRTEKELIDVFQTCSMKGCIAINSDGMIFFCSRQFAAAETDIYPLPLPNEYVDVRRSKDLKGDIEAFLSNDYISTCNYCDGISCATVKKVVTAIQILPKQVFLELIRIYLVGDPANGYSSEELRTILIQYEDYLRGVDEYNAVKTSIDDAIDGKETEIKSELLNLINRLSVDYNYSVDNGVPYKRKSIDLDVNTKRPNVIRVSSDQTDDNADIVVSGEDIEELKRKWFPVDEFAYNRLFLKSKFNKLKTEEIDTIICGLSYTQYGIIEGAFDDKTVNLSVTGQDMAYQILIARHALTLNPGIKTIVLPMAYYQGFYDMVKDDAPIHQNVVSRINIPLLMNGRGYKGPMYNEYFGSKDYLKIYELILDTDRIKSDHENEICKLLADRDYFNELHEFYSTGGLDFDFHLLNETDKYPGSAKTAELNERVVTDEGFALSCRLLMDFLNDMRTANKKVLVFVPPMTKYLYEGYSNELKSRFYEIYPKLINAYYNARLLDLSTDNDFDDSDFVDYEHLSASGAIKLTAKLNGVRII